MQRFLSSVFIIKVLGLLIFFVGEGKTQEGGGDERGGIAVAPGTEGETEAGADEQQRSVSEWLDEGDRLADEKKYTEALLAYKHAYESIVGEFRGRPFTQPVEPRFMTRPELQEYMLKEFKKEIEPEEMRFMDRSLKVFGFAPAELDIEQTLLQLYSEEVAGFYNPRSKEMFLIREKERKGTVGLFQRIAGINSFNKDEQKTTLAHEMTHALADQYYNLQAMSEAAEHNDDMAMAVSALIEGEATLLMLGEMLDGYQNPGAVWDVNASQVEAMFGFAAATSMVAGGRTMRKAPPIFRKTLIFPYHKGTVFAVRLGQQRSWEGIDAAFKNPPVSTEQILHPEKYMEERDDPTALDYPSSQKELGDGWTRLGDNSLGELQIAILLERQRRAEEAAAGWDGDRYEVYEHEDGRLALAWYLVFDSPEDATEFAEVYRDHSVRRWSTSDHKIQYQDVEQTGDEATHSASRWDMERDGQLHVVVRNTTDVMVVEGFGGDETEAVLKNLSQVKKAPLRIIIK